MYNPSKPLFNDTSAPCWLYKPSSVVGDVPDGILCNDVVRDGQNEELCNDVLSYDVCCNDVCCDDVCCNDSFVDVDLDDPFAGGADMHCTTFLIVITYIYYTYIYNSNHQIQ